MLKTALTHLEFCLFLCCCVYVWFVKNISIYDFRCFWCSLLFPTHTKYKHDYRIRTNQFWVQFCFCFLIFAQRRQFVADTNIKSRLSIELCIFIFCSKCFSLTFSIFSDSSWFFFSLFLIFFWKKNTTNIRQNLCLRYYIYVNMLRVRIVLSSILSSIAWINELIMIFSVWILISK